MRKSLLILGATLSLLHQAAHAQQKRQCGAQIAHQALITQNPDWATKLQQQKLQLQEDARTYDENIASGAANKTTAASAIPVVFHIVVDSAQFKELGRTAGIAARCDSQIAVLERDFNRKNSDSTLIPSGFTSAYGAVGIHFGLAHRTPTGHWTPGYEIMIINDSGFSDVSSSFASAKNSITGLPSWDVSKYLNVWCINFTGSAISLLGITTPISMTGGFGSLPLEEEGICIIYNTLGKRKLGTDSYPANYDRGRTLTHECGHFFELWHTWGDDGGLCPWDAGGADDGIADTPPESDATYGNPIFSVTGGTLYDGCKMNGTTVMQPYGKPCINFMDYTDDAAMHMFTKNQASVMSSKVAPGGENFSLTQNPTLLTYPAGISTVEMNNKLNIFPNPTTGQINITYDDQADRLQSVVVTDLLGQVVMNASIDNVKNAQFMLDMSGMNKGIYFVTCNFGSGSTTQKILLQ